MSKERMMVVGYVRVSTENQLENYSIEEQTSRLKAYCAAKDWMLLNIYTDGGFSGGNTDRPALQQMLKEIKKGKIDAVVVYKLDRLSRSQKDTMMLIEDKFLSCGTDFVSINENFDTSTPFGRAMIGILSVFAQLEKDQITERFIMGRIGRSKSGYFHGGGTSPTGYDYINGELVINEYEAIQIRRIFQLFINGKSINSISRLLSSEYTTCWTPSKVTKVIGNTIYIGKVHFMKQEFDGVHEPIIEKSMFEEANRILNSFERKASIPEYQRSPFRAGYLLSGLLFCAQCGAKYTVAGRNYSCYSRCKKSLNYIIDPTCKNDNWKVADLDAVVISRIEELLQNNDILQNVLDSASLNKKTQINKPGIKKQIKEIEGQIEKLIELYQVGGIPMETITHKVNDLTAEKDTLMDQLAKPDAVPTKDLFLNALDNYRKGFNACADTDKKRAFISALVERVIVDGQDVYVRWRL